MHSDPTVAIIGSLNIDFVTRTPRVPVPGETLQAKAFETGFGGKGANQAVAAARLAGENVQVRMVGNVGDDKLGDDYLDTLDKEGIDITAIKRLKGQKTGVTNIIVDEETGENRILFVPNANAIFSPDEDLVSGLDAGVVLFQLEIPLQTTLFNIKQATKAGQHVIFNPAPAQKLSDDIYTYVSTLIMNETEAAILVGQPALQTRNSLLRLAKKFLLKGVKDAVIITLGGDGLVYATNSGEFGHVKAKKANVLDTTAAGDTFVGAFAAYWAQHIGNTFEYEQALEFATLAASKAVEREGAMASIPRLEELC